MRLTCTDFEGTVYSSQLAMCKHYGVSQDVFGKRIASGMSLQEALTRPTRVAKTTRLGEKKTLRSGLEVTIVEYRSSDDIVVRFPDGVEVPSTLRSFDARSIRYPGASSKVLKLQSRVGETTTTTQGERIRLIAYTSSSDVTVEFPDGSTRHTDYKSFQRGNVLREAERVAKKDIRDRIGEQAHNTSKSHPHTLTIIDAVDSNHITVQFEDGLILPECKYHDFKTGRIAHPSDRVRYAVGEHAKDRNGLDIELADLIDNKQCIARYSDGTEVKLLCKSFRGGYCAHPDIPKIGPSLRNWKVSDNLYIEHEIHTDDSGERGRYFVCLKDGGETVLTREEILNEFRTLYSLM